MASAFGVLCVLFVDPFTIGAAGDVVDPIGMGEVPLYGFADAGFKGFLRFPAQFFFQFCRINGIAPVVPGPVGDIGDLFAVWLAVFARFHFIQYGAECVDDFDVGFFVEAADVVNLAGFAFFHDAADGAAMVANVKPVPYLHAISVDGKGLTGQCTMDDERDEFFGKLVGPVVVGAVGGQHGQAVGVVIRAH